MTQDQINILIRYSLDNLDFTIKMPDEYFYAHLPLCVIDAVYSIGVRYDSVSPIPFRYCNYAGISCLRNPRTNEYPPISNQHSISDFLNLYRNTDIAHITKNIYQNSQRTSSRSGILKSEAVEIFANVLSNHNVNYFQDIHLVIEKNNIEHDIKNIPGQKSGISLAYFYMLAGNDNYIKPDRWVKRYLAGPLNISENNISNEDAIYALRKIHEAIARNQPQITLRHLDYIIWCYQRNV